MNRSASLCACGFTLLELLATLALAAVLATGAMPSLQDVLDRRRVEGTAAQLASDLQFARFEAVSHNRLVRVAVFGKPGVDAGTCYLVYTGPSGACRCGGDGTVSCAEGAAPLRSTAFATGSGLWVEANVTSLNFDPLHGTSTPAGVLKLSSLRGHAVQHVVNVMGRVRSCAPQGTMPGLRAC
jgi:type IV fimbrial biogenesis protein FimT